MAAVAYAGYALTRPATHLESVGCYRSASLTADTAVIPSTSQSPTAACERIWSDAFPSVERPTRMTACVLESGAIGVFPARSPAADPCTELELPRLDEGPAARLKAQQFAHLKNDLGTVFASYTCLTFEQARTRAQKTLDENDLGSWTIVPGEGVSGEGFSKQRPCAGLAYDTANHTIVLVPEEPDGGR